MKKLLLLIITLPALGALCVSCTSYSHRDSTYTWPIVRNKPPIATTLVEVTGENENEKLKVQFDRDRGECKKLWVGGQEKDCKTYGADLKETYFCVPPNDDHAWNAKINDVKVYCGRVHFLTDGADIQFKPSPKAANKKCKKIGRKVYCF